MATDGESTDAAPKVDQLIGQLQSDCIPQILKVTVAFHGIQNDQIVGDRTGVLLCIGDAHFIITAAHGLAEIVKQQIPLYVSATTSDDLPVPLADSQFECIESDGVDFALVRLALH